MPVNPIRVGVIDIGSNTLKLTIAEVDGDTFRDVYSCADLVRIGQGVHESGQIRLDHIEKAVSVIASYMDQIHAHGAIDVVAVGTEALRVARNGSDLLGRLGRETGLDVELIDGQREAELTTRGVLAQVEDAGRLLIADVGGGSTEVVAVDNGLIVDWVSLPLGSGTMTDRFVHADPPSAQELDQVEAETVTLAAPFLDRVGSHQRLILVGGVGTFLGRAIGSESPLPPNAPDDAKAIVLRNTANDLADLISTSEDRARVVPAAFSIAKAIARGVAPDSIETVANGLRIGLLFETVAHIHAGRALENQR